MNYVFSKYVYLTNKAYISNRENNIQAKKIYNKSFDIKYLI